MVIDDALAKSLATEEPFVFIYQQHENMALASYGSWHKSSSFSAHSLTGVSQDMSVHLQHLME